MKPHHFSASGGGQATILDRGGADYAPPTLPQPPEGWGREFAENAHTGLCFEALRERKLVGAKVGLGSGWRGWAVLRGVGVGWAGTGLGWAGHGLDWAGVRRAGMGRAGTLRRAKGRTEKNNLQRRGAPRALEMTNRSAPGKQTVPRATWQKAVCKKKRATRARDE